MSRTRMTRGQKAAVAGVLGAMGLVVLAAVATLHFVEMSSAPSTSRVTPVHPRVCRRTGVGDPSLQAAARHFHLVIPRGTYQVAFEASTGHGGTVGLDMSFTTTPARLTIFLAASHFNKPMPDGTTAVATPAPTQAPPTPGPIPAPTPDSSCTLVPPAGRTMLHSQDGSYGAAATSSRSLAVDMTDPAHPVVWVSALDR